MCLFVVPLSHVPFIISKLSYLILCCRKDVNGFFADPVNDTIAPGYSSIILNPMDFSTMESKIETDDYASILDYKVGCISFNLFKHLIHLKPLLMDD